MTTKEIREKAAAILEREGWHQGSFGLPGGPHCIVGALVDADDEGWLWDRAADEVQAELGLGPFKLSSWNDAPGRTKEEVIAALRGERVIAQQPKAEER